MIDVDFVVRFPYHMKYEEVNQKTVSNYLKELEETVSHIKKNSFENHHLLFISPQMEKNLLTTLQTEIDYCTFYLELNERKTTDTNFGKWIFTKKENANPHFEWGKPKGDQWTKTNGKVKVTIELDTSGLMAKITLTAKNDASTLEFIDRYAHKPLAKSHLKNQASINHKIEALKTQADSFLNKHEFPRYDPTKTRYSILHKLFALEVSE